MAESYSPAKLELFATRSVQEQLAEGELLVPSQKYILKDGITLPDASVDLMDVPVIDLGLLTPSSISEEEFDKLRSALTKWGCFQVINHGMTPEFLDKVREVTKQFFAMPLKDNQWFRAPIVAEALLINVGDQAEILSNGLFKSPVHKVVTNAEKERISLAVFCLPDSETEIGPFESLINESRPRLYKNLKNYLGFYFQYYQQGRRPIEAAII